MLTSSQIPQAVCEPMSLALLEIGRITGKQKTPKKGVFDLAYPIGFEPTAFRVGV